MSDQPDDPRRADDVAPSPEDEASRLDELVATRREKAAALRERGVDPYPVGVPAPSHTLAEVAATWSELEPGTDTGEHVRVAGRVVAKREMGRLRFLVLREDGTDLQLFVPIGALDEPSRLLVDELDVGDWVVADGEVMASKRGELSVKPSALQLIGKNLRPLPDKWHGLKDIEQRSRQREVDLVVTEESRRAFAIRARVLRALRAELEEREFIEVETPMLHPIPGGAAARPFVTHHNALDVDLYLRIAPELYLKRLMAGGMRRVYEINRNFRNEGISPRHNPEFTMLECYQAYADYHDMMDLTEAMLQRAALEAVGGLELSYQGRDISLAGPWPRRTVLELVAEAVGRPDLSYDEPLDRLRSLATTHGVEPGAGWGPGKLVFELYERLVEHTIWDPVFVTDHPVETSPLARRHRNEPHVAERFELVATGRELGNAFSELTDPDDQRARFEAQVAARTAGDDEAMYVDEAYLRAMELGMPPMGGLGIGVDRVVMLLADVSHIREVILFPTLRPEG